MKTTSTNSNAVEVHQFSLTTKKGILYRLWVLVSNPFLYVLTGKIRL